MDIDEFEGLLNPGPQGSPTYFARASGIPGRQESTLEESVPHAATGGKRRSGVNNRDAVFFYDRTPLYDRLARRLLRQHAAFDEAEDRAREMLQDDPYNRSQSPCASRT